MIETGNPTNKYYFQAVTAGTYDIDAMVKVETRIDGSGNNGVTAARLVSYVTDSLTNIVLSKFGFIDVKFEDRFDHNIQRTYTLSGKGRVVLNA